ncbi:uncharacterized protein LOC129456528 [Periophthalmus magnuspinnatus]|uniref:uncharacterized protein LOC129456528 n=1 Tax=Periophthalmus magnuspinnatus TaxID=409849 RepID=UPI0024371590|nr:uncharacterized protein LOC129456528 [Periophthalmus magnuspinnatus]
MDSAAPDALPHSTERTEVLAPPELTDGESFHVFVSYSSSDLHWTHTLIQQLEDRGLRVCYHDRDFIPGWPILDNMSSCIQKSQKVLLVLSQDFVRSRWCLLEANISMFRDCLHRKPVVPVLLQRDLSIPLHLSHLTYLEASHPNFSQELLRVLCTPNHKLQNTTMVPHQLPNLYNGKVLQPLKSIDEIVSEIDCGEWSTLVPDQLRLIIKDRAFYMDAIKIINRVNKEKVKFKVARAYNMTFVVLTMCFPNADRENGWAPLRLATNTFQQDEGAVNYPESQQPRTHSPANQAPASPLMPLPPHTTIPPP